MDRYISIADTERSSSDRRARRFELLLFDLDGVLMDTREVMQVAWREVQQTHGVDSPFDAYARYLGRPFAQIMRCLGLEDADSLAETYDRASLQSAHLARPFPDIRATLALLTQAGRRLGVVTSKPERRARPLLGALDVTFVTIRTPGAGRGKPAPDQLLLAMVDAETDPTDTIYVGDMAVDQQAAIRAGVAYAHAAWGYGQPEAPAPVLLETPRDLLALSGLEDGERP